jgi:pimeloyl-ACP methyl ester carboxylesterase
MGGGKAQALATWAKQRGQAALLFDYSGHGQSGGRFADGTISHWLEDTLAAIDGLSEGPLVLVGSSMGGWLAMLAARARPDRVQGLTLIAPATDFVTRLMIPSLSPEAKTALLGEGQWAMASAYAPEPTIITQALLDDGARHCLLPGPIPFHGPVRILQGQRDPDVPWRHALETAAALATGDVRLSLIKDGDHRLSRPQDIALLLQEVDQVCASASA